jgi:hypothetical protein
MGAGVASFSEPVTTICYGIGNTNVGGGFVSGINQSISGVASKCAPEKEPSKPYAAGRNLIRQTSPYPLLKERLFSMFICGSKM